MARRESSSDGETGGGLPPLVQQPLSFKVGRSLGLTRADLESEKFRRLLQGVYILASVPVDPQVEARAGLLAAHESAFVSHHIAAWLWGRHRPIHAAPALLGDSLPRRSGSPLSNCACTVSPWV